MSEGAIFTNSGPLFSNERLEALESTPEWTDDESIRAAFERIRETFGRHSTQLAGSPSKGETRFFMINPTLHALGFTHSVYEPVQLGDGSTVRVDYACFAGPDEFNEAYPSRGTIGFFRPALCLVKSVPWNGSLDEPFVPEPPSDEPEPVDPIRETSDADGEEEDDGPRLRRPGMDDEPSGIAPPLELDALLRATGVDFGILTNGCQWRMYHRGTSERLDTWFQADMIAAMKSDFEEFKRFFLLFQKSAFQIGNDGNSFLSSGLQ